MDNNNDDVIIALEEMRINMKQSLDAGDSLDRKLNQTIVTSGAILSILTTLQLTLDWEKSSFYWFVFYFVIGLYVINVGVALIFAGPKSYKLPISPDWDVLVDNVINKPTRDIFLTLLSGYVDQIKNNRRINTEKARVYYFCTLTIPITVVLLFALVIIP